MPRIAFSWGARLKKIESVVQGELKIFSE